MQVSLSLEGQVAIVTGGASGIGEAIVRTFADAGANVVFADLDDAKGKRLASELKKHHFVSGDLTNDDFCKSVVEVAIKRFGKVDILVNCAGVNDRVSLDATPNEFRASLNKNLVHYFVMAHFAKPHLLKSKGNIVNIGSKVADMGQGDTSGYAASKGGANGLTREWATWGAKYGVRVNIVIPAEVLTDGYEKWLGGDASKKEEIAHTIPLENRFTTPQEIANEVLFLASPFASHTTGQLRYVDGGVTHLQKDS